MHFMFASYYSSIIQLRSSYGRLRSHARGKVRVAEPHAGVRYLLSDLQLHDQRDDDLSNACLNV